MEGGQTAGKKTRPLAYPWSTSDLLSAYLSLIVALLLKSTLLRLAEFYYNTGLQRPYSSTCAILEKKVNRFLCPLVLFDWRGETL